MEWGFDDRDFFVSEDLEERILQNEAYIIEDGLEEKEQQTATVIEEK